MTRRLPTWLIALALVPVCWVIGVLAYLAVASLTYADACYQPASTADLRWARALLVAVALGLLGSWIAVWWRHQWWLLPVGLLACGPAVLGAANALASSAASWSRSC